MLIGPRSEEVNQSIFALADGCAPSRNQMRLILDVIDAAYWQGQITYLHCGGGRGRAATAIGAWLSHHGIASGEEALEEIARLRFVCGVFAESPETEAQRQFVREWPQGE